MRFEIAFFGHKNIRSLHQKTIEITRETSLTPSGDCIVGVGASHACADIPAELKQRLQDPNSVVRCSLVVGDDTFCFEARGDPRLELSHPHDIVIRRSDFVCPRTLAVHANRASDSVPRHMIKKLLDPQTVGRLIIEV